MKEAHGTTDTGRMWGEGDREQSEACYKCSAKAGAVEEAGLIWRSAWSAGLSVAAVRTALCVEMGFRLRGLS